MPAPSLGKKGARLQLVPRQLIRERIDVLFPGSNRYNVVTGDYLYEGRRETAGLVVTRGQSMTAPSLK